jgi:hypothetical protein
MMTDITYDIVAGTKLQEMGANFYAAKIAGKNFVAEYFSGAKKIALSMGIGRAPEEKKDSLRRRLTDLFSVHEGDVQFDDHCACLMIPVEQDWVSRLNGIMDSMSHWADENELTGGCFFCGRSGATVSTCEVGGVYSFLCGACREKLNREYSASLEEANKQKLAAPALAAPTSGRRKIGYLAALGAGFVASLAWLLIIIYVPLTWIFGTIATTLFVNCVYEAYKRVSGQFSIFDFLVTTLMSIAILMVSVTFAFSHSLSVAWNMVADPSEYVTSLAVFTNLPQIISFPLFGFLFVSICIPTVVGLLIGIGYRYGKER